jgi:ABC-type Zn uptake system ZnuABC Zn-binding protein ZnuA
MIMKRITFILAALVGAATAFSTAHAQDKKIKIVTTLNYLRYVA